MRLAIGGMKRALALTGIGLWGAACTTPLYSGPRRNSDEVAVLITTKGQVIIDGKSQSGVSTRVARIDGKEIDGSSFELLPGRHSVEVTGKKMGSGGAAVGLALGGVVGGVIGSEYDEAHAEKSSPLIGCFIARPGHTYEVRTFGNAGNAGSWQVEIVDQNTTYVVTSACSPAPKPAANPSMNPPHRSSPPSTASPSP